MLEKNFSCGQFQVPNSIFEVRERKYFEFFGKSSQKSAFSSPKEWVLTLPHIATALANFVEKSSFSFKTFHASFTIFENLLKTEWDSSRPFL